MPGPKKADGVGERRKVSCSDGDGSAAEDEWDTRCVGLRRSGRPLGCAFCDERSKGMLLSIAACWGVIGLDERGETGDTPPLNGGVRRKLGV